MSKCKCTMAVSLAGDGCRYCQPQEYIDRLEEWLSEEREESTTAQSEIERLRLRVANLEECLTDAVNQVERDSAMGMGTVTAGCIESALDALESPSASEAWLLRKQAEAVEAATAACEIKSATEASKCYSYDLLHRAKQIRQQAIEAKK